MKIFYLFIFFSIFRPCFAEEPTLTISINDTENVILKDHQIRGAKPTTVEFFNHVSRKSENYRGILFQDIIKLAYPNNKEAFIDVELITSTGFKSYINFEAFLKVNSYLTYGRVDNQNFERFSRKEKKIVPLGPYYLVWDIKSNTDVDHNIYSSVYQITKINFITSHIDFGLKNKINDSIGLGFRTFKHYCLSCHSLGNYGGEIGTDLTKGNLLDVKGRDYIAKYALNPELINPSTKMIGLPKYKNKEEMAKSLYDFLLFVRNPELYIKNNLKTSNVDELNSIIKELKH